MVTRLLSKFKLFFIDTLLIKVYGHNNPEVNRLEKITSTYFRIISPYIDNLSVRDKKVFYSFRFRELALFFGLQGNLNKMLFYLRVSLKYRFLMPISYVRFILILFEQIIPFNFQNIWAKIKYSIEFSEK